MFEPIKLRCRGLHKEIWTPKQNSIFSSQYDATAVISVKYVCEMQVESIKRYLLRRTLTNIQNVIYWVYFI